MEKWVLESGSETITITKEHDSFFTVHTDHWSDTLTNSLWFPSYQSARRYVREEMYIEGRFKKVANK
ncbi:hypothetical protein [Robertmurraya siralis]|uniref:hypothetical protein n=1 Tax=Robertmurraya siralis TaxID=77777 RepID=UPI0010F54B3D|nr:hypothetical protein [Robertmurraya siralis]